ncbi:MAG: YXWGXW repeat-containing protein [Filimonas sp.]|nr:YXWGXW repeat-containing protein [Filimonas sp.]
MKKPLSVLILCLGIFQFAIKASAQVSLSVGISVHTAPPAIPVYTQPPCPTPGYLWTPGYWYYGPTGYYWVPGVWIAPPSPGLLWTPGYWGFTGGIYRWHAGYWGAHVGFYGGINYGFGYGGVGYGGGAWAGNVFRYNTSVTNVNTTVIHNTYIDKTVINNNNVVVNRNSFNGTGGVTAQPTQQERSYENQRHVSATSLQQSHETNAGSNRNQLASSNGGHPRTMAMDGVNGQRFNQQGQVAAHHVAPGQPRPQNMDQNNGRGRAAGRPAPNAQEQQSINRMQRGENRPAHEQRHNEHTRR